MSTQVPVEPPQQHTGAPPLPEKPSIGSRIGKSVIDNFVLVLLGVISSGLLTALLGQQSGLEKRVEDLTNQVKVLEDENKKAAESVRKLRSDITKTSERQMIAWCTFFSGQPDPSSLDCKDMQPAGKIEVTFIPLPSE
jgi:hypothetical protein